MTKIDGAEVFQRIRRAVILNEDMHLTREKLQAANDYAKAEKVQFKLTTEAAAKLFSHLKRSDE